MNRVSSQIFNHSHHKLAVRHCRSPLDVLNFEGREALSEPFHYAIQFTSTDKAIPPASMLMQDASLTLQAPLTQAFGLAVQQPLRTVQGVVTHFKQLAVSHDECRYELCIQPRLTLLSHSRQNAIYQDMSVPQIVEKILRERHDMQGQDFAFTLASEYPRREQVMQYGEDDLTFIGRLLAEVGIWYRFTTDARLNIDVVEFYDNQSAYQQGLTLVAVPPSGMHDQGVESVWGMTSSHTVVEKSVRTGDYNYRAATDDLTAQANLATEDTTTYGEACHYADNYLTAGGEQPEPESGAFYARLRHERYLNRQTLLSGTTNCATLAPGQALKVTGDTTVAEVYRQGVVITAMVSSARRDRSFEIAFEAIPCAEHYCFRPALIARPVMAGTLPARVTSTTANDIYGHIDKDGRYRVNLLFDRAKWDTGYESLWVRQARQYAGDTYGLHLPLLAGTEVAIAFEDGNPDRPYIASALHDSAHGDHVTIGNYKRNVLRTPANNKLRMDDERGKEHIKLSTEYGGKSQLNLGHLVDSQRQQRGEGFELRTDAYGAIRAEKGIFISADEQPKAGGKVLAMEPAISLLKGAQQQMQRLSQDAQTANADPADLQAQIRLLEQNVNALQQAVLLLSAPKGIALASGEHLQLSAANNLIANAGNSANISVVKEMFIGVGNALSVFVRKMGMKLIANQGPVTVQAQNDEMALLAKKGITITSTEDEIVISAKKKITLNGGGSFITLDADNIHGGTPGEYLVKAKNFAHLPAASILPVAMAFPLVESGDYNLRFHFVDDEGIPYSNTKYIAYLEDGTRKEGVTDAEGYTEQFLSEKESEVRAELLLGVYEADETASGNYDLRFTLTSENNGEPLANWPYELEMENGERITGTSDEEGNTELVSSDEEQTVKIYVYDVDEEESHV